MDLFGGDRWSDDDDSDDEYQKNEEPPKGIDTEFSKHVLNVKHKLYDETVLSPDMANDNAQKHELVDEYLKHINKVYVLAVVSQNGKKNARNLDEFPNGAKEAIQHTMDWLEMYFSKNRIPDTIPYVHYIRNQFHVYPFVQDNSFMDQE
jgi:hypothetical protein